MLLQQTLLKIKRIAEKKELKKIAKRKKTAPVPTPLLSSLPLSMTHPQALSVPLSLSDSHTVSDTLAPSSTIELLNSLSNSSFDTSSIISITDKDLIVMPEDQLEKFLEDSNS